MKKIILFLALIWVCGLSFSQSIRGQWHGYFEEGGNNISLFGGSTEYVLELEINGNTVSGTSYTYFENRKYYVICSLNGVYNKTNKQIVVNEVSRVKGSTQPGWSDCLQTHTLIYEKQEGKEVLSGKWKTSPYQSKGNGGCGYGLTTLSRRVLNNMPITFNKQNRTNSQTNPIFKDKNKSNKPVINSNVQVKKNNTTLQKSNPHNVVKTQPNIKNKIIAPTIVKASPKPIKPKEILVTKKDTVIKKNNNHVEINLPQKVKQKEPIVSGYEKRNNTVLKTIEIENNTFKVDLYDNGEIDGDSISLFFNGKLILSHKRLSDKAISLTLDAGNGDINELIMFAENLGTIPPNTALMVVTDGDKRYEVRISSDLQNSGVIKFIHKIKNKN